MQTQEVLVTGGAGFIGTYITSPTGVIPLL